ncbi:hypothetical protein [Streptomyces omiyaensis]|uniref:hypothetical protein n=1 Tax=Streptomyces omiyaensis TaxID=68247 RepID=UPI0016738C01|nr:hypothetical protein [Streptomyces omiyaensis]
MKRLWNSAATAALSLLLVAAGAAPAPATSSYEYDRQADCRVGKRGPGRCMPGIVVKHWHEKGATKRGVGWVYASTEMTGQRRTYEARWLYQRPGGRLTAATGWKKAKALDSDATFVEASWGRDGRTGPQYPANTKVCIEFRGVGDRLCVRLR